MFNIVMYTLTTPPTYMWSVHLLSTQQHQGLFQYKMGEVERTSAKGWSEEMML